MSEHPPKSAPPHGPADHPPPADVPTPPFLTPPAGQTCHATESPKGEPGFFVASDGRSMGPDRLRVRPPSFCNLQAPRLVPGHLVADVVGLLGSIDVVLGEVDR